MAATLDRYVELREELARLLATRPAGYEAEADAISDELDRLELELSAA